MNTIKFNLKRKIDVVVAGHVCLDITPIFRPDISVNIGQVFTPGKLTNMDGINMAAAGTVPNVGISLRKLGLKTYLMGKIGNDNFGEAVSKLLKERGLSDGMNISENVNTSYTVVLAPPGIDRMFLHDPGANDTFMSDDIDYDIVKKARLFHFGYPPLMRKMYEDNGEELVKIFKRIKELGVITSLDMAFTEPSSDSGKADWIRILKSVLPYTDIYIPSIEETLYMLERDYFIHLNETLQKGYSLIDNLDINILQVMGERLLSFGTKVVVIKCGTKGYYVRTGSKKTLEEISSITVINTENWSDRELLVETYDVEGIKSTTGSGDCSIAGFLTALLNGKSLENAVKIAHAVATQSIQTYDVFSNIKDFPAICKLVEQGMPTIKLEIEGQYWKFDDHSGVWKGKKDSSAN